MALTLTHIFPFLLLFFIIIILPSSPATAASSTRKLAAGPTPPPTTSPPPSTSTTPPSPTTAQSYTDAHNKARSEVNVPPLAWNASLASSAANLVRYQRIKSRCAFANLTSNSIRRPYGANQLMAMGREVTPQEAVENWVKEKAYYNRETNTCLTGHDTCGVYTQVVWSKSTALGCAQAVCGGMEGTSLTICLYYPPGNVVGERPF